MPVRVHVHNFQSIKDVDVEIDGFTVVTGTNNTGKTALQRAIRGVFQNTSGTAFVREGETTCSVTLDLGDHKVTWSKGTGKRDRPTYVIDGGEPIYPGQSVPEEVTALGVVPIQAGGQEVWPTIAPQFTGQIFLLDKPGSALAEAVADVERVSLLNGALRKAESDRRQAAATLKVREADLAKYEVEVASYQGLDAVVSEVEALEEARTQLLRLARAIEGLEGLRDRLGAARNAVARLQPVGDVQVPVASEALKLRQEYEALEVLRSRLNQARKEVLRFHGVGAVPTSIDETPAKRLLAALDVLKGFKVRLDGAKAKVKTTIQDLGEAEQSLASLRLEADEALKAVGQCPMCGTSTGAST